MARLQDKVIIITGAAQGMGETHARLCLEEGAKVVLTDINSEKGDALANDQAMLALLALLNFENGKSGAFIFTD